MQEPKEDKTFKAAHGDPFPLASFCVQWVPQHPKAALPSWGVKCSNTGNCVGYFRCKPLHMRTYHVLETVTSVRCSMDM